MIYPVSLQPVGIVLGCLLVIPHLIALASPAKTLSFLREVPRSRFWGTLLMGAATIWAFLLVANMDLGEFTPLRIPLLVGIPVAGFLMWKFVEEFLAVRALGMLALLAAEPLLEAAFLRPEPSRLLVVLVAYAWIGFGLFWVGMPYLLRDQLAWFANRMGLWKAGAAFGVVYGLATLACAVWLY